MYDVVPPNVTTAKIAKTTMKALILKIPPLFNEHNGAFSSRKLHAVQVFRSVDSHLQGHERPKLNLIGLDRGVDTHGRRKL